MKRPPIQNNKAETSRINRQAFKTMEDNELRESSSPQTNGYSQGKAGKSPNFIEFDERGEKAVQNSHLSTNGKAATVDRPLEETELQGQQEQAEQLKPTNNKSKRVLFLIASLIALITGSVFAQRWWQFQNTHVSTENAQIKGHLSPISAKISGTIQKVLVEDGDYVKAGQTLLVLEDQDLDFKIQQAKANLAAVQAQLKAAKDTVTVVRQTNPTQVQQAQSNVSAKQAAAIAAQANINQSLAKVEISRASVAQAQTTLHKAQADYRRYNFLYNEGAVSAQQLETAQANDENAQSELNSATKSVAQAQSEVKNAQAQWQNARAEIESAKGQVAERKVTGQNVIVRTDQQKQAQAQVEQAKAELALAQQQIAYTTIKAPINGYVGQLTAQVGQKVQPQQPVLSVVPLRTNEVYVDANFKETALGRLRMGEKAEVEVDAYPGETFKAAIAGISPATGSSFALIPPDNAAGNFNKIVQWVPIRLMFAPNADPQHKLRPGLSVRVTVDTTTGQQPVSKR